MIPDLEFQKLVHRLDRFGIIRCDADLCTPTVLLTT
jgi:hypothetical protein